MKEQIIKEITEKVLVKLGKHEVELANWQEQILAMTENIEGADTLNYNVNLSSITDLKKFISNSKNIEKDFNQIKDALDKIQIQKENILSKKSTLYKYVSKLNIDATNMLNVFEKKMRELGLNPNENDLYNQASKIYGINADYRDKLDRIK